MSFITRRALSTLIPPKIASASVSLPFPLFAKPPSLSRDANQSIVNSNQVGGALEGHMLMLLLQAIGAAKDATRMRRVVGLVATTEGASHVMGGLTVGGQGFTRSSQEVLRQR